MHSPCHTALHSDFLESKPAATVVLNSDGPETATVKHMLRSAFECSVPEEQILRANLEPADTSHVRAARSDASPCKLEVADVMVDEMQEVPRGEGEVDAVGVWDLCEGGQWQWREGLKECVLGADGTEREWYEIVWEWEHSYRSVTASGWLHRQSTTEMELGNRNGNFAKALGNWDWEGSWGVPRLCELLAQGMGVRDVARSDANVTCTCVDGHVCKTCLPHWMTCVRNAYGRGDWEAHKLWMNGGVYDEWVAEVRVGRSANSADQTVGACGASSIQHTNAEVPFLSLTGGVPQRNTENDTPRGNAIAADRAVSQTERARSGRSRQMQRRQLAHMPLLESSGESEEDIIDGYVHLRAQRTVTNLKGSGIARDLHYPSHAEVLDSPLCLPHSPAFSASSSSTASTSHSEQLARNCTPLALHLPLWSPLDNRLLPCQCSTAVACTCSSPQPESTSDSVAPPRADALRRPGNVAKPSCRAQVTELAFSIRNFNTSDPASTAKTAFIKKRGRVHMCDEEGKKEDLSSSTSSSSTSPASSAAPERMRIPLSPALSPLLTPGSLPTLSPYISETGDTEADSPQIQGDSDAPIASHTNNGGTSRCSSNGDNTTTSRQKENTDTSCDVLHSTAHWTRLSANAWDADMNLWSWLCAEDAPSQLAYRNSSAFTHANARTGAALEGKADSDACSDMALISSWARDSTHAEPGHSEEPCYCVRTSTQADTSAGWVAGIELFRQADPRVPSDDTPAHTTTYTFISPQTHSPALSSPQTAAHSDIAAHATESSK